jgi:hypothetical protein
MVNSSIDLSCLRVSSTHGKTGVKYVTHRTIHPPGGGDPLEHPSDEAIEKYVLGRSNRDERDSIEEHLLICGYCRKIASGDEQAIELIRLACSSPRTHFTEDGTVRVWVEQQGAHWAGRIEGATLNSISLEKTPGKAFALATQKFHQAFPEHTCDSNCVTEDDALEAKS